MTSVMLLPASVLRQKKGSCSQPGGGENKHPVPLEAPQQASALVGASFLVFALFLFFSVVLFLCAYT